MRGEHGAHALLNSLIAAAQHSRDRLMYPRVYLQITNMLRCKPQLYAAIGAYVGGVGITGRIFHGDSYKPLARWPLAYLAFILH
jgi:hypothetical protein